MTEERTIELILPYFENGKITLVRIDGKPAVISSTEKGVIVTLPDEAEAATITVIYRPAE